MSEQDLLNEVKNDNLDEVKRLVASGVPVNCSDEVNCTIQYLF